MTSSELRRRIDPTGQPTMHSGSRHCRQEVATRKLSKRSPSRMRRVIPSCASAQALTHWSQRVQRSRSSTSRLCASMRPWRRKSSTGTFCRLWMRARFSSVRSCLQAGANIGEALQHLSEIFAEDLDHLNMIERGTGCGTQSLGGEQSDFAEVVSTREV